MSRAYLVQINGAGGVTPEGGPSLSVPYVSPYAPDGWYQYHFAYRDHHGQIWDTFSKPDNAAPFPTVSEWVLQRINLDGNTSGPPAVAGPFCGTYSDQQHFVYFDDRGTLWDSFYVHGSNDWHLQHINNGGCTVGPPARLDFVSIWVDPTGSQQHFTYWGADRNIYDAFWDGEGNHWHLQTINSGDAATPPAASPPFACTFGMQQHIGFFDEAGTFWDCWYDGFGHWTAQQINQGGRTDLPAGIASDEHYPWIWVNGAFEQHFSYLATDFAVYDAYWDSESWHAERITHGDAAHLGYAKTNALAQAARPTVTTFGGERHIFVQDSQDILRDCWLGEGWNLTEVNGAAGLFPRSGAAASPPFAWSTQAILTDDGDDGPSQSGTENSSASVAYTDHAGTIWSATVTSMPETEVGD
jgi:hypothetical protein